MFKSYLKTASRNIWNHKGFSIINIAGLAIAMTVCIIILFWCRYELNYDKYLPNYDRLYRVNTEYVLTDETERYQSSPEPTGSTLVERFPEITHHCHFYRTSGQNIDEYWSAVVREIQTWNQISSNLQLFLWSTIHQTSC